MQPPVNYYLFLILAHVVCYTAFNSVYRIQEVADRIIMIQGINDQCDVFAHITADVVWLLKKLRCLVNQVGSEEFVEVAFFVSIIEFIKTVCEESECRADVNLTCTLLFQERSDFQDCITGRDHIIDEDHILAFDLRSEEFICSDRMTAVYIF